MLEFLNIMWLLRTVQTLALKPNNAMLSSEIKHSLNFVLNIYSPQCFLLQVKEGIESSRSFTYLFIYLIYSSLLLCTGIPKDRHRKNTEVLCLSHLSSTTYFLGTRQYIHPRNRSARNQGWSSVFS